MYAQPKCENVGCDYNCGILIAVKRNPAFSNGAVQRQRPRNDGEPPRTENPPSDRLPLISIIEHKTRRREESPIDSNILQRLVGCPAFIYRDQHGTSICTGTSALLHEGDRPDDQERNREGRARTPAMSRLEMAGNDDGFANTHFGHVYQR